MDKQIVSKKGTVARCVNGKIFVNDKFYEDLDNLHTTAEMQIPQSILNALAKHNVDSKKVIYFSPFAPLRVVVNSEVADFVRECKTEWAAEQAAKAAKELAERNAAIAACPEGFEPAEHQNSYDGMLTVRAISDGATALAWDTIESHNGIYYIKPESFARSREDIANAKKADAARNAHYDECLAKSRNTNERVVLRRWVTDRCHNHNDDNCSFDNATEWIYPDGHTEITYVCCF